METSVPGTLARHGGARRWLARAWLRSLSEDGSFFDQNSFNDVDREVLREHLPDGTGPRVVLCGHTHAARLHHMGADSVYINTGTWIDLMKPPPSTTTLPPKHGLTQSSTTVQCASNGSPMRR